MIFEFISTTIALILTLVVLFIIRYSIFIYSEQKKYAHIPGNTYFIIKKYYKDALKYAIPGTSPTGILGFFLGDIPTIMKHDRKGMPFLSI
jgi:O-antigen/teichoic acid export membrane protein